MARRCLPADSWRWNKFSMQPVVLRPASKGWVRLNTSDPLGPPLVKLNYYGDPDRTDIRITVETMKLAIQMEEPLRKLGLELDRNTPAAATCR